MCDGRGCLDENETVDADDSRGQGEGPSVALMAS